MGLLITTCLINWNVYGKADAPLSRGFSYIEFWITGVQCNILLAILEYSCVLALKRTNFQIKGYANMDIFIRKIDLYTFMGSFLFFSVFNVYYWIHYE